MTKEELNQIVSAVSDRIVISTKEVLTLDEASRYTGMSKSYIYKLTMARAIPHSKPTGKMCFFNRAELDAWLLSNPVATSAELNARAQAYCEQHKRV